MGEPPRPVRSRGFSRYLQKRAHPLDFQLGVLPEGPAHRTRDCRDELVLCAVSAGSVACHQWRAASADRHIVRSVHRPRARCPQLCLLSGRALHSGRDAVRNHFGAGGRRASIDRGAAHRHGAGRACGFRARFRRRTGGDSGLRIGLHSARGRCRAIRTKLAAR